MFRILSVTWLHTRKALHLIIISDEWFCIHIRCIIPIELQRFECRNLYCYRHCGCPACVRVSVRSFLPPRASRPRNIGTYVFTAARKTLYIAIIIVIFAENASFRNYGWRQLLASNAITAPELQNTDTNGIHAMWA